MGLTTESRIYNGNLYSNVLTGWKVIDISYLPWMKNDPMPKLIHKIRNELINQGVEPLKKKKKKPILQIVLVQ